MQSRVGLIGVGLMGHGIGLNLLKSGWSLNYLDHPGNQDTDDLLALGARSRDDAGALAAVSDVVILCVTGTPEAETVMLGGHGVLSGLKPGSTVIDCTTSVPTSSRRLADAVAAAGGNYLDAPMTRTPREAAEGRLNLIVGGDEAVLKQHRPLLESFSENITHAGPVGAGHTLKLLHNFVSLGYSAVLSETAACAAKAGIDEQVLVDVLAKGGGAGVVLDRLSPFILDDDSSGFRFSLANAHKDMAYYMTMTESLDARSAVATTIRAIYEKADACRETGTPVPELLNIFKEDA